MEEGRMEREWRKGGGGVEEEGGGEGNFSIFGMRSRWLVHLHSQRRWSQSVPFMAAVRASCLSSLTNW